MGESISKSQKYRFGDRINLDQNHLALYKLYLFDILDFIFLKKSMERG